MDTKFKLIGKAQKRSEQITTIAENFKQFAKSIDHEPAPLMEAATQVLAALRELMQSGQPLTKLGLSPSSLGGLVAGIDVLTKALPNMADQNKRDNALKVLGSLQLGGNMTTGVATALAQLAPKSQNAAAIKQAFEQYAETGQANPDIMKLLGNLQMEVDKASRTSNIQAPQAPVSGTVSTVGQAPR